MSINVLCTRQKSFHYRKLKHALRCNIARYLSGASYRSFSITLADSDELLRWFTNIHAFSSRKARSKSSLERYEKYFNADVIADVLRKCLAKLNDPDNASAAGLHQPIDCSEVFADIQRDIVKETLLRLYGNLLLCFAVGEEC